MLGGHKSFDKRVQMLERARQKAPRGYVPVAGPDGIVFARKRRSASSGSLRGLIYLAVGLALFKAIALVHFGPGGYAERVEALRQGTLMEQVGAVLMQPDRVSTAIAEKIGPLIN